MTAPSLHGYLKSRDSAIGFELLGPPNGRLLDIGCGEGEDLRQLEGAGWQGVGVDPVRTPRGVPCVRGDAQRLPFRDESFSATICVLMLPHVSRPDVIVAEAHRALKPRGRAVSVVFSRSLLNAKMAVGGVTYSPNEPRNQYRSPSVNQLRGMLEAAGFRAISWTKSDFLPWFHSLVGRTQPERPFRTLDGLEPRLSRSKLSAIARKIAIMGTKPGNEGERGGR